MTLACPAATTVVDVTVVFGLHDERVEFKGSMHAGSPDLIAAYYLFTESDGKRKYIEVPGAGPAGAFLTTIQAVDDAHTVTLAAPASPPVAAATVLWGTDDTEAVQRAIDALGASGAGGTVCFEPGTYLLNTPLTLHSKIHLRGAGQDTTILDFSGYAGTVPAPNLPLPVIAAKGTAGSRITVLAPVPSGATTLVVAQADGDALGLAPGDRLILGSEEPFRGLKGHRRGEQVLVKSVVAVTHNGAPAYQLTLSSPTFDSYGTWTPPSPPMLQKLSPVVDSGVHDLSVRQSAQEASPTKGIQYLYAERISITNVRLQHCTEAAIRIYHGLACSVENCAIEDTWYRCTGTSYGVNFVDTCQECRVTNNYFRRFRHAISIGKSGDWGIPRMIVCQGNVAEQTIDIPVAAAYDIHQPAQHISYIGTTARTGKATPGFTVDGYDVLIANNLIYGGGGIRVGMGTASNYLADKGADLRTGHVITGNAITLLPGAANEGIALCTSGCTVTGNRITAVGEPGQPLGGLVYPIHLFSYQGKVNAPVADVLIADNQIDQGVRYGIAIKGEQRVRVCNNLIRNIAGYYRADTQTYERSYAIYLATDGPAGGRVPCKEVDIVGNTIVNDGRSTGLPAGIWSAPPQDGEPAASDLFTANNYINLGPGARRCTSRPANSMRARGIDSQGAPKSIRA